ncbi:MAG: valine--tRNA ligase [Elusimicrobia bacterium CG08_land_8_20_14_0_20_59_10]|nr:MAG: valine--tRNA ligase [Elusimicrobia bacterium CG08_land_8_20_14_0_20_59_10]
MEKDASLKKPAGKPGLPASYLPASVEPALCDRWEKDKLYYYDPSRPRNDTFVVDTPPPTVSGELHIGHVFSYVQTDIITRYQRMLGKNVFYPMGWDDNGLPTERRVQNLFGVRCSPALPYIPGFKPAGGKAGLRDYEQVSRRNFLELCSLQTLEDEKKYEALWRRLGLSVDWRQNYSTVGEYCRKTSQLSFLDLHQKGYMYSTEAPTLWDTTFKTAVAQAEAEDREVSGFFHDIKFGVEDGGEFTISTTRPELLAACVAVVAHPEDSRYKPLFGKRAVTPLFKARVPIMPSEHANPEKGTGIMMICTFGDIADVELWRKEKLPLRQIIGRDGKLSPVDFACGPFDSADPAAANAAYAQLAGLYAKQARAKTGKLLSEAGVLAGEPKPTRQAVKFYEKGELPLEFVSSRQWFINVLDNKPQLLEQGGKAAWHPGYMFKRYEQWVKGLNQDWCISRQRYFGVPFPVWYPVKDNGDTDFSKPIISEAERLPVDPQTDCPPGYTEARRGLPGGFVGDPDVMDTWATSSLTPMISSRWADDKARHAGLFPADLRPQAHEIIRTWAFYTIAKAWMHENSIPWHNVAISGWVVSPDKGKMSKSKGKTVSPEALLGLYSADALRYWAGKAKLGQDTVYDESVFKVGMRLATKLFNAAKFTMLQLSGPAAGARLGAADITEPLDKAWVDHLKALVETSREDFGNYDYAAVLLYVEKAFWDFCDTYLELVKNRAYSGKPQAARSACASLEWTLSVFLRLFAPFLPFITEEAWGWSCTAALKAPSVHKAPWPSAAEMSSAAGDQRVLEVTRKVLEAVRTHKAAEKRSVKWPVAKLTVECGHLQAAALKLSLDDLIAAGNVDRAGLSVQETGADDKDPVVVVELGSA